MQPGEVPDWIPKLQTFAESALPFEHSEQLTIEGPEELVRFAFYCSPSRILQLVNKEAEQVAQVTTQLLLDSGINAFALQLLSESLAGKKDIRTFRRLRFEYRGVIYTLEPSIRDEPRGVSA